MSAYWEGLFFQLSNHRAGNSSTRYQTKDSYRSIGALPSGPVSAEGRFVSHLESTRLLKPFQLHFRCLKVQKKESDYPWARSPQLIGAMSKIALSPPLTILCLLELLTEHLGRFVEENAWHLKKLTVLNMGLDFDWVPNSCCPWANVHLSPYGQPNTRN